MHGHTIWYYFGGMTLFFLIQVTTGILLCSIIDPAPARPRVHKFLMTEVQFGWLVRSIHAWSANLMVFAMFIHLFSALLGKAYRAPRELTWLSGGVPGLTSPSGSPDISCRGMNSLLCHKSGYGNTWCYSDHWPFLRRLLRGGDDVTGATLTRFYGIHVAVLPAIVAIALGLHLFLVQKHGMSTPRARSRRARPSAPCLSFQTFC